MGNPKKQTSEELHGAARSGDLNAVQAIYSTNPLAVNSRDKHSRTPLHLAAWSGHAEIVDYLCKNKADVGAAAMDDMGAIHFAAQKGHLDVVRLLVTAGVSVKSSNRKGMTALHYAAQGSHVELVKYLLKKGANVNTKNKAGKTPVDLASNEQVSSILRQPETAASSKSVPSGEEKRAESESMSEKTDQKDESLKRKGDIDETTENSKETKKAKVALNHLLASDDNQEDEENL